MRRSTTRSRPPVSQRPLRMLLAFVALLLAVALPAQAQENAPPPDPLVVVVPADGGEPLTVPWSQLAPDAQTSSIHPFQEPGKPRRSVMGIALGDLFRRLGIAPTTWSGITVDRAEGGATAISSEQMLSQGGVTGIVFKDGDNTLKLLRQETVFPLMPFELASAIDGRLTVRLQREAKVTAAQQELFPGQKVAFSATLPPGVDPAHVSYEWDFNDDGDTVRTKDSVVTRSFARVDEYNVSVTFYVDGTRYTDDPIPPFTTVHVIARQSDEQSGGSPEPTRRARSRGRGRGRRARARRSQQPDDGDAASPPPSTPPPADPPADVPSYTPPATPVTPAPTPTPTPSPAATPTPTPTPKPRPKPKPKLARRTPVATAPQGETVDGYLLASAGAPLPIPAAAAAAPGAASAAQQDAKALHVPTAVWVLGGLAALVMLGWGLEARTTLPYFKP